MTKPWMSSSTPSTLAFWWVSVKFMIRCFWANSRKHKWYIRMLRCNDKEAVMDPTVTNRSMKLYIHQLNYGNSVKKPELLFLRIRDSMRTLFDSFFAKERFSTNLIGFMVQFNLLINIPAVWSNRSRPISEYCHNFWIVETYLPLNK